MWLITTLYSILTLNWKITDSVRPLMAAQQFLMVITFWIDLYFKKLKRTHPFLSPSLSLFIIIIASTTSSSFGFVCVIEKNVWSIYLPLYLWMYLLFTLSKFCSIRPWLMLLHKGSEFIYKSLLNSAFSVAFFLDHKCLSIRRLNRLSGERFAITGN